MRVCVLSIFFFAFVPTMVKIKLKDTSYRINVQTIYTEQQVLLDEQNDDIMSMVKREYQ